MAEASILILGATGAVGAALARRVASRGLRPVLVARDPARLAALAAEIPGSIAIRLMWKTRRPCVVPWPLPAHPWRGLPIAWAPSR